MAPLVGALRISDFDPFSKLLCDRESKKRVIFGFQTDRPRDGPAITTGDKLGGRRGPDLLAPTDPETAPRPRQETNWATDGPIPLRPIGPDGPTTTTGDKLGGSTGRASFRR